MRIDVLTLFPETFDGALQASILGRALREGVAEVRLHNIRDYAEDKHSIVDDYAYGGGPLAATIESVRAAAEPPGRVVLLTPQGRLFNQQVVDDLAAEPRLVLLCGHYEGVDERIREHFVDDEVSIGDYVLSGGEYAAMVVIDAVVRRQPGTLGSADSLLEESHSDGLLEYPQYTWSAEFRGW
jgi:tRNA (guanine37-N1)-methyltransferase